MGKKNTHRNPPVTNSSQGKAMNTTLTKPESIEPNASVNSIANDLPLTKTPQATKEEVMAAINEIKGGKLKQLEEQLQHLLASERLTRITQIKEWITAHSITSDELYPLPVQNTKGTVAKTKGKPKYRHPTDLGKTWSGHGRQPGWVIEYLEIKGNTNLDPLLIK